MPVLYGPIPYQRPQSLMDIIQQRQTQQAALRGTEAERALRMAQTRETEAQRAFREAQTKLLPQQQQLMGELRRAQIGQQQALAKKATAELDIIPFRIKLLRAQAKAQVSKAPTLTDKQKIFEKEKAKVFGERVKNVYKEADTATKAISNIQRFRSAMKKIPAGWAIPHVTAIAEMHPTYGKYVSEAKTAHSALTADFLKSVKTGQLTEREREFFERAIPDVGQYKSVALKSSNLLEAKYKRDLEKKKFISMMLNEGKDLFEAETWWENYINRYSLVDDQDRFHPENITKWRELIGAPLEEAEGIEEPKMDKEDVEGTGFSMAQYEARAKKTGRSVRQLIDMVKRSKGLS